jgi:cell wall-associated NlpC family hydrolase
MTPFAAVAALVLGLCAVLGASPAGANPAEPGDPIGSVTSVKAVTGGLLFTGWAADPDALTTNVTVGAIVDGYTSAVTAQTSIANATVTTKYHTGPTPGFTLTVPIATGSHTACLVVRNIGGGLPTLLKCVATPLGTTLTSAQLAKHSPRGAYTSATASSTSLRVTGWATDPDYIIRKATVVVYVDGTSARTVHTTSYPAPRPSGAGSSSLFDVTVSVAGGAHIACIWVVNIGFGSNSSLGCKAVDTRGPAGTGTLTTPALNTAALAQAKRHIGQAYVWGAAGPTTFDCSGLVVYSYAHPYPSTSATPMTNIPHQSELQFNKARLIPASRALPGDLVFYFDNEGDVYHVGIYISPGKTVAAIDEAEGVNYQTIWDPSSAVYGSLTHT